ncbi:MAG: alpha/beta hydrolase [Planctomycetes bacterium]|nr:alpha/beta hydrolase [Planctomycetota bacterium]
MRWRRSVHWILILGGAYLAIVLLVFLFQERLIFVGSAWPRGPLDAISGVTIERLTTVDGRAFRIAHAEPDESPHGVILWFGGNGEDLRSGVYTASRLAGFGVEAITIEYPGYGESEGRPGIESIYAAARRAAEFARARAMELGGSWFVGGNSLGTFCAVFVASEFEVDGVVLNAPPTSMVAAARYQYPWLPVGWLLRHRFDSLALAPKVAAPVWITHGTEDDVVPYSMGRELAEAFRESGEEVEFHAVDGDDHTFQLGPQQPYGQRLRSFLARH